MVLGCLVTLPSLSSPAAQAQSVHCLRLKLVVLVVWCIRRVGVALLFVFPAYFSLQCRPGSTCVCTTTHSTTRPSSACSSAPRLVVVVIVMLRTTFSIQEYHLQ